MQIAKHPDIPDFSSSLSHNSGKTATLLGSNSLPGYTQTLLLEVNVYESFSCQKKFNLRSSISLKYSRASLFLQWIQSKLFRSFNHFMFIANSPKSWPRSKLSASNQRSTSHSKPDLRQRSIWSG